MKHSKQYYQSIKAQVKELYTSGLFARQVAERLNICEATVQRYCRQMNIARRPGAISLTKYEDFFDDINTEEKAYFLGFIMADGNVSTHNNQWALKIHLAYKDREIIDKFCTAVQTNIAKTISTTTNSTEINKQYKTIGISLTSKHMVLSLMKHGVYPKKSGKEFFPVDLNVIYYPHFIRGYFDGDGCITYAKNKSISISGGLHILNHINNICFNNQAHIKAIPGTFWLYISKIAYIKAFYKYIYTNATIYLLRKYNTFLKYFI